MNSDDPLHEPILGRRELFRGGYLTLEELTIGLPNGREGVREVVRVRDAVAVLPVMPDGTVRLVRQHRAAIGRTLVEAPAGVIDDGESPEEAARRECQEEVGLHPHRLTQVTTYAHAEGYSTGFITLYIGEGLEEVESPGLDETEFVERVDMSFHDLLAMVERGEIVDSKTILTALYWREMSKTLRNGF